MRIPSQFAKALRSVQNRLRREFGRRDQTDLTDPVEQLVLSILATDGSTRRTRTALRRLSEEMIDFNELRVTPAPELAEALGPYVRNPYEKAQALIAALSWAVVHFDTMDLTILREKSQADLRSIFESVPGCPDHARDAMLLLSFGVPAFPIDQQMLEYLQAQEALPEATELGEARSYIERHLKAAEVREFYLNVKEASEREVSAPRKQPAAAGKPNPRGRKK